MRFKQLGPSQPGTGLQLWPYASKSLRVRVSCTSFGQTGRGFLFLITSYGTLSITHMLLGATVCKQVVDQSLTYVALFTVAAIEGTLARVNRKGDMQIGVDPLLHGTAGDCIVGYR